MCLYVCIYVCPVSLVLCLPLFLLQGIKAVLAESYERIHRSNLVGMGVIPLQFLPGQSPESLGLTGRESYTITLPPELTPGMMADVSVSSLHNTCCSLSKCCTSVSPTSQVSPGTDFKVLVRFDTDVELEYFKHGGILNFMVRKLL